MSSKIAPSLCDGQQLSDFVERVFRGPFLPPESFDFKGNENNRDFDPMMGVKKGII